VKLLREYIRVVLSLVPVARRGRLFGFGTETQALDEAAGLKSARGSMRNGIVLCGFVLIMRD